MCLIAGYGGARSGLRYTGLMATTKNLPHVDLPPDPVIEVYKKDIDRTLLVENLKLSVEERFRQQMNMHAFTDEVERSRRKRRDEVR